MKAHEPLQYLPFKGIDPRSVCHCCSPKCNNKFLIVNGVAFQGTSDGGQSVGIYFFCSSECYLKVIPTEILARA